ncbi:unnamed protein product [Orchesella dallaii]|uniref:Uncharacterized protein n=1 Tax=Orchesella dallaii TaxID=48710 RepID=A0ABP1PT62_9HEXA
MTMFPLIFTLIFVFIWSQFALAKGMDPALKVDVCEVLNNCADAKSLFEKQCEEYFKPDEAGIVCCRPDVVSLDAVLDVIKICKCCLEPSLGCGSNCVTAANIPLELNLLKNQTLLL